MDSRSLFGYVGMILVALAGAAEASPNPATFNKDVLPILQQKCQSCHRPGQSAPMSLLTYADARPWARSMKAAVATGKMPPWFADPRYGHFRNDIGLSQSQIDLITNWVDGGAIEGAAKDAPPPLKWPADGWQIAPDVVVTGVPYTVPAQTRNNVIEWMWVVIPSPFKRDTWVSSMEIRPSEPSVTHHICVRVRPHTPDVNYNEVIWEDKERDNDGSVSPEAAGGTDSVGRKVTADALLSGVMCPVTHSTTTAYTMRPS
jgi:hypothetical protein